MKKTILIFSFLGLISCKTYNKIPLIESQKPVQNEYYTIAFGSCDDQKIKNELWPVIDENHPSVWIWGGDNVYSDTEDMQFLKKIMKFRNKIQIISSSLKTKLY
jgi:alkaline phosphatase D